GAQRGKAHGPWSGKHVPNNQANRPRRPSAKRCRSRSVLSEGLGRIPTCYASASRLTPHPGQKLNRMVGFLETRPQIMPSPPMYNGQRGQHAAKKGVCASTSMATNATRKTHPEAMGCPSTAATIAEGKAKTKRTIAATSERRHCL